MANLTKYFLMAKKCFSLLFSSLFLIFLSFSMPVLAIRDAPVTTAGSIISCPNNQLVIPILVNGFTNVMAVTLRLEYTDSVMTFISGVANTKLSGTAFNATPVEGSTTEYKIMLAWYAADLIPVSLSPTDTLAKLTFAYVQGNTGLDFNNVSKSGSQCEYADETWAVMTDTPTENFYFNGTVSNAGVDPAGPVTGSPFVCVGATGVGYSVAELDRVNGYVWSIPEGATIASGANTRSITLDYGIGAISGNISVYGYNECGLGNPSPAYPVTVYASPVPSVNGNSAGCVNVPDIYSTETGMTGYLWTVSAGGMIIDGANTATVTIQWTTSGSKTISVNYTNQGGCAATTPTVFPVTVYEPPVPSVTGPSAGCVGYSGNNYVTESGMTGYSWSVSPGGTITSGSGSHSIFISWTSAGTQSVSVTYTNTYGCVAISPTVFPVNIGNSPAPTLNGLATLCQGATVTYTTEASFSNYSWGVSSGGSIVGGGTPASDEVTVYWHSAGNQIVFVNYTNAEGCQAPSPAILPVTVNQAIPTINGNQTVCLNSTEGYSTETGMSGYVWTVSSGGTIIDGANTATPTIQWSSAGIQTITVNYTNPNGCSSLSPSTYPVTVYDPPVPTISGPSPVCVTFPGNIYTTEPGMTGYIWGVSPGGVINSGAGLHSIDVTWNLAGAQTVTVSYTNPNGCNPVAPASYAVTVNTIPEPTLTGSSGVCREDVVTYTTEAGQTDYSWGISPGGIVITGGTATSHTAMIYWFTAGTQSVSINYTNGLGCQAPTPTVLPVMVSELPVPTIQGSSAVCLNSRETYFTEPGMSGYSWTVSAGGTIVSGAGTNSVTITWNLTGPQTVNVRYTSPQGCSAENPTIFHVTVNSLPVPTISGPGSVVEGTSGVVYTTETGMSNYNWTISTGGIITEGGTTASVTVTWTTAGNQSISVTYTDQQGCMAAFPSTKTVTVTPLPVPVTLTLRNIDIPLGPDTCFNATQTITLAGTGSYFTVQNGAMVTLVAGQNIVMLPGTTVFPGGYLHGYITLTGQYCESPDNEFVSNDELENSESGIPAIETSGAFFKVFPNPSTGKFTIQLIPERVTGTATVKVYNLLGNLILEEELHEEMIREFSMEGQASGIYIIHVIQDRIRGNVKLLIQK